MNFTIFLVQSNQTNLIGDSIMSRMQKLFICQPLLLFLFAFTVYGDGHDWRERQIKDALMAAPPVITDNATIYGWDEEQGGKMTLLRLGTGNYTCIATGFSSLRIGKPLEPIPGPACADENAWAFFKALLNEENPMKPQKPYPTTPGMVWMLAGMGIKEGMVDIGSGEKIEVEVVEGVAKSGMIKITPHIMILPLPISKSGSLSTKYDPANPLATWIMAANSPLEHLMIHVSDEDVEAIMQGSSAEEAEATTEGSK